MVTSTAHRPNTKLPLAKKWAAYCEGEKKMAVRYCRCHGAVRHGGLVCYLREEHQENKGGETHFDAFGDLQGRRMETD